MMGCSLQGSWADSPPRLYLHFACLLLSTLLPAFLLLSPSSPSARPDKKHAVAPAFCTSPFSSVRRERHPPESPCPSSSAHPDSDGDSSSSTRRSLPARHSSAGSTSGLEPSPPSHEPLCTEVSVPPVKLQGVEVEEFTADVLRELEGHLGAQLRGQGAAEALSTAQVARGCVLLMASVQVPGRGNQQVQVNLLDALPPEMRDRVVAEHVGRRPEFLGSLIPDPPTLATLPSGTVTISVIVEVVDGASFDPVPWAPLLWALVEGRPIYPLEFSWETDSPLCHMCRITLPALTRPTALSIKLAQLGANGHVSEILPASCLIPVLGCEKAAAQAALRPGIARDLAALMAAKGRISEGQLASWLEVSEYLCNYANNNGMRALTQYLQGEVVPDLIRATCRRDGDEMSHGSNDDRFKRGRPEVTSGRADRRDKGLAEAPSPSPGPSHSAPSPLESERSPLWATLLGFKNRSLEAAFLGKIFQGETSLQAVKQVAGYFVLTPMAYRLFRLNVWSVYGLRGLPLLLGVLLPCFRQPNRLLGPWMLLVLKMSVKLYAAAVVFAPLHVIACETEPRSRNAVALVLSYIDFLYSVQRPTFTFTLLINVAVAQAVLYMLRAADSCAALPNGLWVESLALHGAALLPLPLVFWRELKARRLFLTDLHTRDQKRQ